MARGFCGKCGRLLGSKGEICPSCRGDNEMFCPECGADVHIDDISCSYCGIALFADAEKREADKRERFFQAEKEDELVCVKTTISRVEGEIFRALLGSFGIWSLLKADDCAGMRPYMTYGLPARIYVRRADGDRALEVLKDS